MVDKSWSGDSSATLRIRTNATPDQRTAARAEARALRESERASAATERLEARAATRAAAVTARETARTARRESERQAAAVDPHAAAARRPRSSGRRDIVREQRDTSHYTTVVDAGRMRELARRGASPSTLAAAFGISEDAVAQALAEAEGGASAASIAAPVTS